MQIFLIVARQIEFFEPYMFSRKSKCLKKWVLKKLKKLYLCCCIVYLQIQQGCLEVVCRIYNGPTETQGIDRSKFMTECFFEQQAQRLVSVTTTNVLKIPWNLQRSIGIKEECKTFYR